MKDILKQHLQQLQSFPSDQLDQIIQQLDIRTYSKDQLLIQPGAQPTACYFILSGCVRQYQLDEGKEKTTAFFTEGQAVVDFSSYQGLAPANAYFVCAEACELLVGTQASEAAFYEQFPTLATLIQDLVKEDFAKTQHAFQQFRTSSPEQRYQQLLTSRPDLFQRVPQHQIASYLGVTAESLSRIRRRLAPKHKS